MSCSGSSRGSHIKLMRACSSHRAKGTPNQVSISEGEEVEVLEEADGWTRIRKDSRAEGVVPTNTLGKYFFLLKFFLLLQLTQRSQRLNGLHLHMMRVVLLASSALRQMMKWRSWMHLLKTLVGPRLERQTDPKEWCQQKS